MLKWFKKICILTACLLGLGFTVVWLGLSTSLLDSPRGHLVARMVTAKTGQTVFIRDGVNVDLGSVIKVSIRGLAIPNQSPAEVNLAEVGDLHFDVSPGDLFKGILDPQNIRVARARIALLVDEKGEASWPVFEPENSDIKTPSAGKATIQAELNGFLTSHKVEFIDSNLIYKNALDGLDLDLHLTSLRIGNVDQSVPLALRADGRLNGQDLSLTGSFSPGDRFALNAEFEKLNLQVDGVSDQTGITGSVTANIDEVGQLLDLLKLKSTLTGTGRISAKFSTTDTSKRIDDIKVRVALDGGQSLELTADLGELGNPDDVSVDTKISLFALDDLPAPARARRDLKLTGIDMQLIAQPGGIPKRHMVIATNGFVIDTHGEGPPPIVVSDISRSPEGQLKLGAVELRIGPPQAPFLVLEGSIADALQLEGIDVEAILDVPAASLLAPELFQTSLALGKVSGGFNLSGTGQQLELSDLKAMSQNTDLWDLNVSGSIENAIDFNDVSLDVTVEVPSGTALLTALDLKPVEIGPVHLDATLASEGLLWDGDATIKVEQSQLEFSAQLDLDESHPFLSGRIDSDLIRVDDLRHIIASAVQLGKLDDLDPEAVQNAASIQNLPEHGNIVQPLVLKDPNPSATGTSTGTTEPLSTSDSTLEKPGPFQKVTLRPLGQAILLSGMDLDVKIDLHKIEGRRGEVSLQSDLVMKDEMAQLGPINFEIGGGHFDITALVNLAETPEALQLSGSTGGWNFADILHELKFDKAASGILNARFDISGNHSSIKEFIATMSGGGLVTMRNGSIDNQLLDLAGLGILPWLFSKDRGVTAPIVCLRMPINVANGTIGTKQAVVETDLVQVVVNGNVNMRRKTLDVAGQPRKIGKPLSRSPWPFTAAGPIAKPQIKLKDGPRRIHRADGASSMPERRRKCVPDVLQLR
ncbi:AsmA-like C-terminal region-containing protein [Pseudophaeobacter leonis]|uniref:AsmA-like C-terminal region-containing protein n=1 Tax=Pseudophaeobacter leonis TaxID=1144477 RepID=UPI0009F71CED|nr:AsmA-like C-terminal region-containing protein [Pseudophaeobacter leonis]